MCALGGCMCDTLYRFSELSAPPPPPPLPRRALATTSSSPPPSLLRLRLPPSTTSSTPSAAATPPWTNLTEDDDGLIPGLSEDSDFIVLIVIPVTVAAGLFAVYARFRFVRKRNEEEARDEDKQLVPGDPASARKGSQVVPVSPAMSKVGWPKHWSENRQGWESEQDDQGREQQPEKPLLLEAEVSRDPAFI
ncbi:hypothetical protein CYMTET_7587 [Cymbomonas tetramitiformis]|uniref:Uncharacterized protein n=1 Tax=Cymbomonas tetramitiformis TaxID=36881 RepID=A0AAE0LGV6_9CHLO|nr:hypothetical protein CYMTET_7587 [Cymbomonas tetramitiformis]